MSWGHGPENSAKGGIFTLCRNQSGPIRASLRKLGLRSQSQPAATVEAAGVTAIKPGAITRRDNKQKLGSLEGKHNEAYL